MMDCNCSWLRVQNLLGQDIKIFSCQQQIQLFSNTNRVEKSIMAIISTESLIILLAPLVCLLFT